MTGETGEARGPTGAQGDASDLKNEFEQAAGALAKSRSEIERLCRALLLYQQKQQWLDEEGTSEQARQILADLEGLEVSEEDEGKLLAQIASSSDWVPAWILMQHEENFGRFLRAAAAYMKFVEEHGAPTDLEFISDAYGLAGRVNLESARISSLNEEYSVVLGKLATTAAGWLEPAARAAYERSKAAFEAWDASPTDETEKLLMDELALAGTVARELMILDPDGGGGIDWIGELGVWWERLRESWRKKVLDG
jgi:hypothetical protein